MACGAAFARSFKFNTSTGTGLSTSVLGLPREPITVTSSIVVAVGFNLIATLKSASTFTSLVSKPINEINKTSPVFTSNVNVPLLLDVVDLFFPFTKMVSHLMVLPF